MPTANGGASRRERMTGVARWEDPPPSRGRSSIAVAYEQLVALLQTNPGHWGVVATDAKSTGMVATLKKYGLEATSRKNVSTNESDPDTYTIYARATAPVVRPQL